MKTTLSGSICDIRSSWFQKSLYLQEKDLLPPDKACPFCLSPDRDKVAILQKDPDVYLRSCLHCHAASASRMPSEEVLKNFYSSYYEKRESKITFDMPEKLAAGIYKIVKGSISAGAIRILDFGGGNGEISVMLAERLLAGGADEVLISVVDYHEGVLESNNPRIALCSCSTMEDIGRGIYDIVIASAIIEHIPAPRKILLDLFDALKPSGIFYARTPYVLPFMKLFQLVGMPFDFTYPGHVHDLGNRFWENLFVTLPVKGAYEYLKSGPSPVETTFGRHFGRTVAAYLFKAPWYVVRNGYNLVGGWEVFIRKKG